MLQGFWVTAEVAGGCGLCYDQINRKKPAAAAGTAAHGAIQNEFVKRFGRLIEFEFISPTDENRRLDLAVTTPTGFKIGEIKPANKEGEQQGIKDLDFYTTTLQAAYPRSTIELMEERLPSGLRMPDSFARSAGVQTR